MPLVAGDRWYNTSNGTEWFWNGTYWLSTQLYSGSIYAGHLSATATVLPLDGTTEYTNIFIVSHILFGAPANAPQDSDNYWKFDLYATSTGTAIASVINSNIIPGVTGNFAYTVSLNNFVQNIGLFSSTISKIGNPGNLRPTVQIVTYRLVYL